MGKDNAYLHILKIIYMDLSGDCFNLLMNGFRFRNYQVYKEACILRRNLLPIVNSLEERKEFSLKSQITRASDSIILNIAEGCSRKHKKDFSKYISYSIGSANEVVACIDICTLIGCIEEQVATKTIRDLDIITKQLVGLRRSSK